MNLNRHRTASTILFAATLAIPHAFAQIEAVPPARKSADNFPVQTLYLTNASLASDTGEIISAIRNILTPESKIYFVPSQNALILRTSPDQFQLAQKLLSDLDRPRKTYRLIYTLTEMDGAKRLGFQHFAIVVVSGQRTTLKQGSRVPLVTGSYNPGGNATQTQVTYLDIGINLDATLDESVNGVRLRTKAEQSSVAPETSGLGIQDPLVRQTILEGTSILSPGKPLVLGSLDVPGSTRHLEVEVVMEVVH